MVSFVKGMAGAAAAAVAAVQPQDAEANSLISHSLKRAYALGMVKKSEPNGIKQYETLLRTNPAFARKEAIGMQNDFKTVMVGEDIPPRKIITPDEMLGQTIAPVRGDMSYNAQYSMIDGLPVNVTAQGGHTHSRKFGGWASSEAIAKGQHNKLIKAQQATDTDKVIAVYDNMGRESVNFSTPPVESMVQQTKLLDIPKEDIKLFDDAIRNQQVKKKISKEDEPDKFKISYPYKDWVGLDSPDVFNQLEGQNGFPQLGKLRTVVSKKMQEAKFRKLGFPSYEANINAFNDPALANNALGTSGYSSYVADTSRPASAFSGHKSYDTAMHGSYLGGLDQQVPFDVMFPKTMDKLSQRRTKAGKPYTRDQSIVAANIRKDGYEVTDQKWLDGVSDFIERNKAAGGVLTFAGGAASANASEDSSAVDDLQSSIDFANYEREQNTLPNKIKNYFDSPADGNFAVYDEARARGEDTIEANRSQGAADIGAFINKYTPDIPILGQVLGTGIGDALQNRGYNKTKGNAAAAGAFAGLDFLDIGGAGMVLKNAGKQAVIRGGKTMYHGTSAGKEFDRIDPSKLQGRDAGFLGKGFYTGDSIVASRYAKNMEGGNVQPIETAAGRYKNYTLQDKQNLGMAVNKDPSLSEMLTQQNTLDGYIGARVLDSKGGVVEQVNYFPTRDVENAIKPFSF